MYLLISVVADSDAPQPNEKAWTESSIKIKINEEAHASEAILL